MPVFEIKSRFDGSILHTVESDSLKMAVEILVEQRANLVGAYLVGAYLERAKYGDAIMELPPVQILGLTWDIFIFDSHLKIGCQIHPFEKWHQLSDKTIAKMHGGALDWWKINKEMIFAVIKTTRGWEKGGLGSD
jgi:hypothetical protein